MKDELGRFTRTKPLNEFAFNSVDTEESAYWLGFFAADGCVYKSSTSGHTIRLTLAEKDAEHVQKFKNFIGDTTALSLIKNGEKRAAIAVAYSKQMFEDLFHLGIVPNKSLILEFPKIDEEFVRHVIRGYIDGDGSFCKHVSRYTNTKGIDKTYTSLSVDVLGTFSVLRTIRDALPKNALTIAKAKPTTEVCRLRGFYSTSRRGDRIQELYDYLYSESTLCLQRKREIVEQFL